MRDYYSIWFATTALAVVSGLRGQEANPDERVFSVLGVVARIINTEYRELDDRRRRLEAALLELAQPPKNDRSARIGWKVFGYDDSLPIRQWVEIDLGAPHRIDAIALIPADAPAAGVSESGIGFPLRFRVELADENGSLAVIADYTAADFPNPGGLPVFVPARGTSARRVRVTMHKPWSKNRYRTYALGEIMVLQGNRNLATGLAGVTVQSSGSLESAPAWSRENLIDGQSMLGAPLAKSDRPLAHGWESARFDRASTVTWVQIDLGAVQPIDEVRLLPARLLEYTDTHGYGFPGKLRVEISEQADFSRSRVLVDWAAHPRGDPVFNPLTIPGRGWPAQYVRATAEELWQRREGVHIFALAEMQVYRGDSNLAAGAPVTASSVYDSLPHNFSAEFLTDGLRAAQKFVEWPEWLAALSRRREVLFEIDGIRARMAAIQPVLVRAAAWTIGSALSVLVVGTLAVFYRARRAQARTVVGLQRRIAGDLHDEIGSNLASIALLTELGQRQNAGIPAGDVEEIRRLANESAAAMRDIVWLIQPGPHDAPLLAERLRAAARRLLDGLDWKFEITGLDAAPSLDVQRHLLLALKEMLHNVLRHAGARRVEIHLSVCDERFTLEVRDDGRGFEVARQGDGHGFTSLRHRAEMLGGELALEGRPGQGVRVALNGSLRSVVKNPATSI